MPLAPQCSSKTSSSMSLYRCCRCRWHCLAVRDRTRGQAGQPVAVSCSCVPVSNCPAKCTGCAPSPSAPLFLYSSLQIVQWWKPCTKSLTCIQFLLLLAAASVLLSPSFFFLLCAARRLWNAFMPIQCILLVAACPLSAPIIIIFGIVRSVPIRSFSSVWFRLSLSSALCKSD